MPIKLNFSSSCLFFPCNPASTCPRIPGRHQAQWGPEWALPLDDRALGVLWMFACGSGFSQCSLCGFYTPTIIWELTFLLQIRNLGGWVLGQGPFTPGALPSSPSPGSCRQAPEVPEGLSIHVRGTPACGGLGGPVESGIEEPL